MVLVIKPIFYPAFPQQISGTFSQGLPFLYILYLMGLSPLIKPLHPLKGIGSLLPGYPCNNLFKPMLPGKDTMTIDKLECNMVTFL